MIKVIIGQAHNFMASRYTTEDWENRKAVTAKVTALCEIGFNVLMSETDTVREFYVNFETDNEAILFKLTFL